MIYFLTEKIRTFVTGIAVMVINEEPMLTVSEQILINALHKFKNWNENA